MVASHKLRHPHVFKNSASSMNLHAGLLRLVELGTGFLASQYKIRFPAHTAAATAKVYNFYLQKLFI